MTAMVVASGEEARLAVENLLPYNAEVFNSDGHVVLVVGGQKIVADVETGLRRINEYCLPLEDHRAREAYGVGSGVNNVLIVTARSHPAASR